MHGQQNIKIYRSSPPTTVRNILPEVVRYYTKCIECSK